MGFRSSGEVTVANVEGWLKIQRIEEEEEVFYLLPTGDIVQLDCGEFRHVGHAELGEARKIPQQRSRRSG